MRVLFAGTPEAATPTLRHLINSSHEIVGVISRPDAPVGRGKVLTPSAVSQMALDAHLPLMRPDSLKDPAVVDEILSLKPDVAIIVAYGALIREPLLTAFPWVNLHFSLLPAYRGAAPVQHAILNGEEITGVSAFILDQGLDTGPLLGQMTERIRPDDTTGSLLNRLSEGGAELIDALLARWDELTPKQQLADGVSVAPKIDVDMARIDWSRSAELIERHIRAMNPAPGAWTQAADSRLEVLEATLTEQRIPVGKLEIEKKSVLVGTGSTALSLLAVKPQGKRVMSAADWARGLRGEIEFS